MNLESFPYFSGEWYREYLDRLILDGEVFWDTETGAFLDPPPRGAPVGVLKSIEPGSK